MMSTRFAQFVHLSTSRVALGASKSNLAKLRKKTGYPFGNCKKALEANNNDLEKAEKWLEDQAKALGWSKAMKMENRNTPQGLVGVAWDKQHAAMVEVNCETDFVSRNEKFQKLVDVIAKTCLHQTKVDNPSPKSIYKVMVDGLEVGKLVAQDQQSLADHVVRGVGVVGERLVLRRAAFVSAPSHVQVSALTHPAGAAAGNFTSMLGKYGAILLYTAPTPDDRTAHLAKQLCQHVIGMNPIKIEASPDDPEPVKPATREPPAAVEGEEDDQVKVEPEVEEDPVMMRQTFLLDPDRTVADVVAEGGLTIEDFVRFECGDGLSELEEATTKVAQAGG